MLSGLWVTEALGKTKVDHVDIMLLLADSDQEVVWFDVSVQEMAGVDKLNALELNKKQERVRTRVKLLKLVITVSHL